MPTLEVQEDGEPGADRRCPTPRAAVPLAAGDAGGVSRSRRECSNTPKQENARRGEITPLARGPRAKHTRSLGGGEAGALRVGVRGPNLGSPGSAHSAFFQLLSPASTRRGNQSRIVFSVR